MISFLIALSQLYYHCKVRKLLAITYVAPIVDLLVAHLISIIYFNYISFSMRNIFPCEKFHDIIFIVYTLSQNKLLFSYFYFTSFLLFSYYYNNSYDHLFFHITAKIPFFFRKSSRQNQNTTYISNNYDSWMIHFPLLIINYRTFDLPSLLRLERAGFTT